MNNVSARDCADPELIRLEEAARILAVSRRTVVRMAGKGHLEILYITPDLPRVRRRDVLALVGLA